MKTKFPIDLNAALDQLETELVRDALLVAKGNKAYAAHLLGINRTTLVQKCKRLGFALQPKKTPPPIASPYI